MQAKKKIGRPTDNPKNINFTIRLDEECVSILEKYCKQEEITRTDAIRKGIKKLKVDLKEK
ncbi:hypothetical protein FSBG_00382 [Fusobacterium gonidiaformans 3-1-5R]|uniref:Uncharacterized protein n=1 Tax=Fusobacterium gonidiaformans 3-1-5R TaxID=469605 RepID=E5BFK4_9FUSO|nr:hypothetical protein [Fusobacterium gonidiaformans]EFS20885.1 hypothetical protein FSBG_00382 [Fusobacterium gonidiaformans 3-1-5R]